MNDHDALLYLKNLLVIAYADGILAPSEEAFIESCRTQVGAKKSVLNQASKDIDGHCLDISGLSRFSLRVRNLEDIIELAMCDGQLQEEEKTQIAKTARDGGMTQEIVNLVLKEAKNRRSGASPTCSSCGASVAEGAKYCPECGAPLEEAQVNRTGTRVELLIPESGVTISFAESTGASFPLALDEAKRHSSYQEATRGKKKWYAVTVPFSDSGALLALASSLGGLRNKEVFLNGEASDWNVVFGYAGCASEREKAYDKIGYCFGSENSRLNLWGCRAIGMDWSAWSEWFTFGQFRRADVFVFDMQRIVHELEKKIKSVRLCPHLRLEFISEILKAFPREALVAKNAGWEYQQGESTHPNAVEITIRENEYQYKTYVIGVRPIGTIAAKPILSKAIKKTRSKDIELVQLGVR